MSAGNNSYIILYSKQKLTRIFITTSSWLFAMYEHNVGKKIYFLFCIPQERI